MKTVAIATFACCVLAAGAAFASSSSDSELQTRTYKSVPYISGGYGIEERESLRTLGKNDNLELSFALANKAYIDGAKVVIKNSNGKEIFDAMSNGPLFFAELPKGTYTVDATAMGRTEEQKVQVPSQGQAQLYFTWKS